MTTQAATADGLLLALTTRKRMMGPISCLLQPEKQRIHFSALQKARAAIRGQVVLHNSYIIELTVGNRQKLSCSCV